MKITLIITIFCLALIWGCGASTGSRHGDGKPGEKEDISDKTQDVKTTKKFDITPYHARFEFPPEQVNPAEIWYGYDNSKIGDNIVLTDTVGYRVEVLSTDDLEQARSLKSELWFRLKENVYIIFDSPLYKVRLGDFLSRSSAENESFKLKQIGYTEVRVVSDSIKAAGR